MIAIVLVAPDRADYLVEDIEAAGLERTMVPIVAANAACRDAVAGHGVFDTFLVDTPDASARRALFGRGLRLLERRVADPGDAASRPRLVKLVRSLEWRLRVVGRIGRLGQPFRNRRVARRFPLRLADRLGEISADYPIDEVWVYDAWILPQVMEVFDGDTRILVR